MVSALQSDNACISANLPFLMEFALEVGQPCPQEELRSNIEAFAGAPPP
jgi:hypothetical protein